MDGNAERYAQTLIKAGYNLESAAEALRSIPTTDRTLTARALRIITSTSEMQTVALPLQAEGEEEGDKVAEVEGAFEA